MAGTLPWRCGRGAPAVRGLWLVLGGGYTQAAQPRVQYMLLCLARYMHLFFCFSGWAAAFFRRLVHLSILSKLYFTSWRTEKASAVCPSSARQRKSKGGCCNLDRSTTPPELQRTCLSEYAGNKHPIITSQHKVRGCASL